MQAPFKLSFSVATINGGRIPFQSKDDVKIASVKSPHCFFYRPDLPRSQTRMARRIIRPALTPSSPR